MSLLHKLQWRYATKKFDPTKDVPEEQVTELLKAMNLSASSYGLQPYEFIVVKDNNLQARLREASFDQSQLTDASHVIVIAARKTTTPKDIRAYIENIARIRDMDVSLLSDFEASMNQALAAKSLDEQLAWATNQAFISLGTLLLAAADVKIDVCPMGGFEPDRYDEILGLKDRGLHAAVIAAIGYRSQEDETQHFKKVRKHLDDITELRYGD
ncbi:NAD(P)H-dependent oxidoreductase [Patescibacteria group bacterium]|nr:NAD(P)H-dependent oxidoreductase [Patescibacteria group bacterium]